MDKLKISSILNLSIDKTPGQKKSMEAFIMRKDYIQLLDAMGAYKIFTVMGGRDKCLDVKENVEDDRAAIILYRDNGQDNQIFFIKHVAGEYFAIVAANSLKVLDVFEGKTAEGTPVIQYPFHGGDNQLWKIEPTADGTYRFVSKQSGLVLDVKDEKMEDNTPLIIWKDHGGKNQRFTLQAVK